MPTVKICIEVPEGARVMLNGVPANELAGASATTGNPLEKYWNEYLSQNGRKVFRAAARLEDFRGPGYTFDDIAANLSITYESVKSMHRSTGRTAKRWRKEQDVDEPIKLVWDDYEWDSSQDGQRTRYHLPPGVTDAILELP